eukprot:TRINITY_DN109332_c0_g1_i1.p1 TRINITY_DN109332_c0_g1~~TRINITY_DN109332_c0_g1_i1.p1  ORF type:complete len:403 (+),score=72.98 TRINITY_DN109332_c0_g1_i1:207-1415(+)
MSGYLASWFGRRGDSSGTSNRSLNLLSCNHRNQNSDRTKDDRAALLEFVEAGERAKAADSKGNTAEASRLYALALQKAAPLGQNPSVKDVVSKFQARLKEITSPLESAIHDLIVAPTAGSSSWEDVVGLAEAKQALWEAVVLPRLNPELFTGIRSPPKGVLLYGPPGNGKTFLAKAAANLCKATFFAVSASSLASKWHGESEKLVQSLFKVARQLSPSIVFIDEIDSILSARSASESEVSRRLKTEFLVQLEGVTQPASASDEARLVILAATNRPFDLDEAVLRRFPVQIQIPLPDNDARLALLQDCLRQQRHNLSALDLTEMARRTEMFSSSDLTNLCRDAAMAPVRELSPDRILGLKPDQLRPLVLQDFSCAMEVVQPSVSASAVAEINSWAGRRAGRCN